MMVPNESMNSDRSLISKSVFSRFFSLQRFFNRAINSKQDEVVHTLSWIEQARRR